jgi:ABC-type nitrate/sulfonate/bicarbonate transport system substrate-binding protein
MKTTAKIILASSAAIIILYAITFCGTKVDKINTKILIGYQEIALYQHIFTAFEKGYFKEEGLDVELKSFASANQMMEAFLAGKIDVLGLNNLQVALTIQGKQENQFKFINFLVWSNNAYPDYIITRKDAKIRNPLGLEGHTIGLHPGSAVKGFSQAVFSHFNLNSSKITTIELKPEIMQSTLIAGKVDAVYCMDPVATTLFLSGQCDTLIPNPMQYIFPAPTPISGTSVSAKLVGTNPEAVKKLIKALNKAIEYLRNPQNKNEIAGYIAKYTPVKKEQTLKMNPSVYWTFSEIQPDRVQSLANKFFELKIVDKKIEVGSMLLQRDFLDPK